MISKKLSSLKDKSTVKDLLALNKKFREKELLLEESFYKQLEVYGCEIDKSFIIDVIPDSGNTYVGTIINQNMKILYFDIDTVSPEYTIISEKINLNVIDKIALEILQTLHKK